MQRDPLGYVDGMSTYAYYAGIRGGIDPLGLATKFPSTKALRKSNKAIRKAINSRYAGKRITPENVYEKPSSRL